MIASLRNRATIISERLRGMDVTSIMQCKEAGLDPKVSNWYSPSGDKYLESTLRQIGVTENDTIIDVGCGKGSAMLTMLKFPFARVDGLELSPKLVSIAWRNLRHSKRSVIFNADARGFSSYLAYKMFYFYNPFPANVMCDVMKQIQYLACDHVTIIYNNPTCHETVLATGMFHKVAEYPNRWGTGINVYYNE